MELQLPGKAASILLSAVFLSPSMAIADLDGNGFSECDRHSAIGTQHCSEIALNSSNDDDKSNIFHAFPFTVGGIIVSIFIIYLLYNIVMIVILIGRLLVDYIIEMLKKSNS